MRVFSGPVRAFPSLPILWVFLLAISARAAARPVDVEVQRLDGTGLEFVLRPALRERGTTATGAWMVEVGGCSDPHPRRQVQVALPPGARPIARVLDSRARQVAGPLAGVAWEGENPAPLLAWEDVEFRDLRLLVLTLDLLRVHGPASRLVEEVTVRVDFGVEDGGAAWERPSRLDAGELEELVLNPAQAAGWAQPGFAARDDDAPWDGEAWVRIPVRDEGLYQLTPAMLSQLGLDPATLDPATMKLYGYGGAQIPDSPTAPRNSEVRPREIPLIRQHDGDGAFESGERIILYGRGTSALVPQANGSLGVQDHFYSDVNQYWLLVGGVQPGKEMAAIAGDGEEPFVLPVVRWRGLLNEHKGYGEGSARACVGDLFNLGTRAAYAFPAPLPGASTSLRLEYDFYPPISMPTDRLAFTANGGSYPADGMPHSTSLEGVVELDGDELALEVVRATSSGLPIRLNWLMPSFEGPARFVDGRLAFELPATPGTFQVDIQDAPASFWVVDVTDFDSLRVSRSATLVDRVKPLTAGGATGRSRRYVGAAESALRNPGGLALAQMPDLKAAAGTAEMIVVAPRAFAAAAGELVELKNSQGEVGARLALLEDIYDEFNGGVADPGALRNFLRHEAVTAADPARFVLFVGNGHYDYRGLLAGGHPLRIPAWYWESSSLSDADWMVDDWFAQVESTTLLSFALGRLPANNEADVRAYTAKLAAYEAGTDLGPWRNRMLFVADDEHGENDRVDTFEMSHSQDTEELIRTRVPESFEVERLYIFNYPTVYNPALRIREKPQAEARLLEALADGAALVNYMGHGNNTTWAHEYVFNSARHFPLVRATGRPAIFLAATCSWAEIDLPLGEAFPQQLMNLADGGAIGVLAATRKTGATSNFIFANTLMQMLFSRDDVEGWPEMGDVVRRAKNQNASDTNRKRYLWLGDPSLRPGFPRERGHLEGLTSAGQPVDTLLSQALAGFIMRVDSLAGEPELDGTVQVTLRQAPVTRRHVYDPVTGNPSGATYQLEFEMPGALVFAGSATLADGRATPFFMLPGQLDTEGPAVLRCHFQELDAAGGLGSGMRRADGMVHAEIPLAVNPHPATDTEPPRLRLFLNGPHWREGDWAAPNSTVVLQVEDSSGVNLTGELGHRIELTIDGGLPEDLTPTFQFNLDDWTRGEARLPLPLLDPGTHLLRARAFDAQNNPGYAEAEIRLLDQEPPRLVDVVNFPNPVDETTRFTFRLLGASPEAPSQVDLQVFTVKGRRVARERLALSGGADFLWSEDWEPRNDQGEPLARGVYFYRLGMGLPALTYSLLDEDGEVVVRSQAAARLEATGRMIVE